MMSGKTGEGVEYTGQQPNAAVKRPNLRDGDPQAYEVFLEELREACGLSQNAGKTLEEVVEIARIAKKVQAPEERRAQGMLERILHQADTPQERGMAHLSQRVNRAEQRISTWRNALIDLGWLNPTDGTFQYPPQAQNPPVDTPDKVRENLATHEHQINAELWLRDLLTLALDCEREELLNVFGSWSAAVHKAKKVLRSRLTPPPHPGLPPQQGAPNPVVMFIDQLVANSDMSGPSAFDILKVCLELAVFLIDKNRKYGDSALDPVRIMSSSDPTEQIKVRMDDKLSRLYRGHLGGEDAMQDLVGYWVLLQVAAHKAAEAAQKEA